MRAISSLVEEVVPIQDGVNSKDLISQSAGQPASQSVSQSGS